MTEKLTAEEGKRALTQHAIEIGQIVQAKYGPDIEYPDLLSILDDSECVRYPTRIEFSTKLKNGMFAEAVLCGQEPDEGYVIRVHECFIKEPDRVVAMVLYHLVAVNYGTFATPAEAEAFGATCLGMDQLAYYESMCDCAARLPSQGTASSCGSCS